MSERREPSARTLDDLCRSRGTMATFRAGLNGQTHQWTMRVPSGEVLAQTVRVHRGPGSRSGHCSPTWRSTGPPIRKGNTWESVG